MRMAVYKLSPSSLSLMQSCKRCFWLEKNGVWKRPSGIFPSLPSGVDGILKKHFDKFRNMNRLPPELVSKGEHCKDMRLFGDTEKEKNLLKIWRSNFKGLRWQNENGDILHGAVDNILVKNGKLLIIDYKTRGFKLKSDSHEHYRHQLDVYNYLLRKMGYETENYGFLLYYIPEKVTDTGEIVFQTHLIKIEANPDHALRLFNEALELLRNPCPEKSCEWCSQIKP